jgi:hypothetical protein
MKKIHPADNVPRYIDHNDLHETVPGGTSQLANLNIGDQLYS